jgi:hypothetical protein
LTLFNTVEILFGIIFALFTTPSSSATVGQGRHLWFPLLLRLGQQ